jgi:hypothetical protein
VRTRRTYKPNLYRSLTVSLGVWGLAAAPRRSLGNGLKLHENHTMQTDPPQPYVAVHVSDFRMAEESVSSGRFSQSDLDQIALRLNQRPRKTLGFETPESRPQASVASTP